MPAAAVFGFSTLRRSVERVGGRVGRPSGVSHRVRCGVSSGVSRVQAADTRPAPGERHEGLTATHQMTRDLMAGDRLRHLRLLLATDRHHVRASRVETAA